MTMTCSLSLDARPGMPSRIHGPTRRARQPASSGRSQGGHGTSKEHPWPSTTSENAPAPSKPRLDKSRSSSARVRSCGWARRRPSRHVAVISTGAISVDFALGVGGVPRGPRRRDLRSGVVRQDDPGAAGHRPGAEGRRHGGLRRRRARARRQLREEARRRPRRACWSPSPTTASRRSRSSRCSCAPAASTSSSSTRWPRWCRGPRSKARWATRRSASRRD